MFRLALNREFLLRHLFAALVFVALGGWFAYDGLCRYPATGARELYLQIEQSEPPANADLSAFKRQKTVTQRILGAGALTVGAVVLLHLLAVAGFRFAWDCTGFVHLGKRRSFAEIAKVDDSDWNSKRILFVRGADWSVKLDGWHHRGVAEFLAAYREWTACEAKTQTS